MLGEIKATSRKDPAGRAPAGLQGHAPSATGRPPARGLVELSWISVLGKLRTQHDPAFKLSAPLPTELRKEEAGQPERRLRCGRGAAHALARNGELALGKVLSSPFPDWTCLGGLVTLSLLPEGNPQQSGEASSLASGGPGGEPPPLGRLCGKFSGLMGFSAGVRFPSSSAWGPLAVSADISGCRISGGGKGLCAHP